MIIVIPYSVKTNQAIVLNPSYKSRVNRTGKRLNSPTMLLGQQRAARIR